MPHWGLGLQQKNLAGATNIYSNCFVEYPPFWICRVFLMTRIRLCIWGRNPTNLRKGPFQCILLGGIWCLSHYYDTKFDHLVKVLCGRFLHRRIIIPLVINQYSVGTIINTMNISYSSSKLHPLLLTCIDDSHLNQLLLWCLSNGDSLTLPCFQCLFIGILFMRKSFPFFTRNCSFIYINMGSRNPTFQCVTIHYHQQNLNYCILPSGSPFKLVSEFLITSL